MRTGFVYAMYKVGCDKVLYIGSTWKMTKRRVYHTGNCYNESSQEYNYDIYKFIRDNGNIDKYEFHILEEVEVVDLTERRIKEQEYIDKYGLDNLLNMLNAYESPERKRERNKISCRANYSKHKETRKKYNKNHYEENKDAIKLHNNEYKNRPEIKARRKERDSQQYMCYCGTIYSHSNKARHYKTPRHTEFDIMS